MNPQTKVSIIIVLICLFIMSFVQMLMIEDLKAKIWHEKMVNNEQDVMINDLMNKNVVKEKGGVWKQDDKTVTYTYSKK